MVQCESYIICMLFSVLLSVLLPVFAHGACYYLCSTCVNPNNFNGKQLCTSCYTSYVLVGTSCYDCTYCSYYGICNQCNTQSSSSSGSTSTNMYSIIFGTLAGVTFICIITVFIYYRYCRNSAPRLEAPNQISAAQLASIIPSLKWKKSEYMINGGQNCAICLESNVTSETKCKHLYHPKCIWQWCTKREVSCPLCKSNAIDPVHLYCQKCFASSIQTQISTIPGLMEDGRWKYCDSCREEGM